MNCKQNFLLAQPLYSFNGFLVRTGLALQFRELIEDPETSIGEVVELLSCTPSLSRHIMRIANNKARDLAVENLHDAIIELGAARLYDIVENFRTENPGRSPLFAYRPHASENYLQGIHLST